MEIYHFEHLWWLYQWFHIFWSVGWPTTSLWRKKFLSNLTFSTVINWGKELVKCLKVRQLSYFTSILIQIKHLEPKNKIIRSRSCDKVRIGWIQFVLSRHFKTIFLTICTYFDVPKKFKRKNLFLTSYNRRNKIYVCTFHKVAS